MTESEWLSCRDPIAMLRSLSARMKQRPSRLIACACCRMVWEALADEGREAVACIEQYADGHAGPDELDTAVGRANEVVATYRQGTPAYSAGLAVRNAGKAGTFDARMAALVAESAVESLCLTPVGGGGRYEIAPTELAVAEDAACSLVRDVAGRAFTRIRLARQSRTTDVRELARAVYDERLMPSGNLDPARLSVLADALEEIGVPDDLIAHLRTPGPHVRGCWAVDFCLGLS